MHLEIAPALAEHEPVLANLLELYAHDFSEFIDLRLGADGRFGYKRLPSYWKEPDRFPFLIKADNQLAGFAFVSRGSEFSGDSKTWDMSEFFIVRGYRRLGLGSKAARSVWNMFPGKWEVRVMARNRDAVEFWSRAIEEFLGRPIKPTPFEKYGEAWHVFSFESGLPE